ncbi:MAG TPA: hypothetical protein VJ507_01575 [Candidatus Bathyarchaeia archaeon]|nr:hypothetical protein [Candidatus Bathyarchaeia archaeon]
MATKDIRLQYTGYIIFAAKIIGVATGLVFQFMLARSIPNDSPEYGIWGNINYLLPYFTLLAGVMPFWVMRCVARGQKGATKTGLTMNLLFSLISTAAYLIIIPIILPSLLSEAGISNPIAYLPFYLIVSIQIIEMYMIGLFEPCLQASKPQSVGYGLILQQVARVILGYVIIIQLGQPLLGAIVSGIIAFGAQTIYYFKLARYELKERVQWRYVKEWLKGSVLNIYFVVGSQIAAFIFIMLIYYGGVISMELYYVALQMANVITHASFLAFALYPKLLAEKRGEDITASMKTVLMFALPMTVGAIAMSSSYMVLLRTKTLENYPGAEWILIILALDALVTVVSGIYASILTGVETVDQERMSFKSLTKSKLFKYFSLTYVHSAITIPIAFYVLTTFAFQQPLLAALSVVAINSAVRFAMFIILVVMVRPMLKVVTPWRSIAKYLLASAAMGMVLLLLPYSVDAFTILLWTAIGGAVYLAVLMLIDKEARALPRDILHELTPKKKE